MITRRPHRHFISAFAAALMIAVAAGEGQDSRPLSARTRTPGNSRERWTNDTIAGILSPWLFRLDPTEARMYATV